MNMNRPFHHPVVGTQCDIPYKSMKCVNPDRMEHLISKWGNHF